MIGKAELCLDYGLPFFALIDALTEDLRVLFEEQERKPRNKLDLARGDHHDLELEFLVVVFEDFHWPPNVLLALIDWGQGMSLFRPCLTVVNPLFNSLILFPCVVTGKGFDTWKVWTAVEDLILFFQDFKSLLSSFVLV